MKAPTQAQKDTANNVLRAYVKQGATFSLEHYQGSEYIFRAHVRWSTIFVIVGARGAVKRTGWV